MLRIAVLALFVAPLLAAPVPKAATPAKLGPNSNRVLKAVAGKCDYAASTEYQGYPVHRLFDGDEKSPWYSAGGDAPMAGATPWVRVNFHESVTVRRVTILGNRDPQYPTGYFVTAGTFELLDSDGGVLAKKELTSTGDKHDFDWALSAVSGVRSIRFVATKDEKVYNCVGLAEFQVE